MDGIFDIKRDRPAKRIQQALYLEMDKRKSAPFKEQEENELMLFWMR